MVVTVTYIYYRKDTSDPPGTHLPTYLPTSTLAWNIFYSGRWLSMMAGGPVPRSHRQRPTGFRLESFMAPCGASTLHVPQEVYRESVVSWNHERCDTETAPLNQHKIPCCEDKEGTSSPHCLLSNNAPEVCFIDSWIYATNISKYLHFV